MWRWPIKTWATHPMRRSTWRPRSWTGAPSSRSRAPTPVIRWYPTAMCTAETAPWSPRSRRRKATTRAATRSSWLVRGASLPQAARPSPTSGVITAEPSPTSLCPLMRTMTSPPFRRTTAPRAFRSLDNWIAGRRDTAPRRPVFSLSAEGVVLCHSVTPENSFFVCRICS